MESASKGTEDSITKTTAAIVTAMPEPSPRVAKQKLETPKQNTADPWQLERPTLQQAAAAATATATAGQTTHRLDVHLLRTQFWRETEEVHSVSCYSVDGKDYVTAKGTMTRLVEFGKPEIETGLLVFCLSNRTVKSLSVRVLPEKLNFCVQPHTGRHFEVDTTDNNIRVYDWPVDLAHRSLKQNAKLSDSYAIASCENHYFYAYQSGDQISVACMNTKRNPPVNEWHVRSGLAKHRALNAFLASGVHTQPRVIVSSAFKFNPKVEGQEVALKCLRKEGVVWQVTCQELEPSAKHFDLRSVDNDGITVFVLNVRTGCITMLASDSGQVLGKVLTKLSRPGCLSINKTTKQVAVVENFTEISVFKLHYGDINMVDAPADVLSQPPLRFEEVAELS